MINLCSGKPFMCGFSIVIWVFMPIHESPNEINQKCCSCLTMPPLIKQPALKPIPDGNVHWVDAGTQLPDDSVIGGYENEFLYIIRAHHRGSFTPGKYVPSLGLGFLPWGGLSNEKSNFQVLCGYDCTWVSTQTDNIPPGAIEAGHTEIVHETLYIGRAKYQGHLIPGKVAPSHKVCYIAYKEQEIAVKEYEILVHPNENMNTHRICVPLDDHDAQHQNNEDYHSEYESSDESEHSNDD